MKQRTAFVSGLLAYRDHEIKGLIGKLIPRLAAWLTRIDSMTVRLDHFESPADPWGPQLLLFDAERSRALAQCARAERLTLALDRVRDRFGARAIQRGRTLSLKEE